MSKCLIAVMTKDSKTKGPPLLFKPGGKSLTAMGPYGSPMSRPTAIDMVKCQKLKSAFATTGTFASIIRKRLQPYFSCMTTIVCKLLFSMFLPSLYVLLMLLLLPSWAKLTQVIHSLVAALEMPQHTNTMRNGKWLTTFQAQTSVSSHSSLQHRYQCEYSIADTIVIVDAWPHVVKGKGGGVSSPGLKAGAFTPLGL